MVVKPAPRTGRPRHRRPRPGAVPPFEVRSHPGRRRIAALDQRDVDVGHPDLLAVVQERRPTDRQQDDRGGAGDGVGIGFIGVLIIIKPGSASFNIGSIFILLNVLFYVFSVMVTRGLQTTDSSATMSYYSSLVYVVIAIVLTPIVMAVGEMPNANPSIVFLFRAWSLPTLLDLIIMFGLGLVWAGGMYFIARAYSLALASVVAPFEYMTLPISTMWGFLLWHDFPPLATWIGAFVTLVSSLYTLYQDQKERSENGAKGREKAIIISDEGNAEI